MSNEFQFLIYKSAEENVSVNAFIQNESIWITANQMAILFDKSESTIRKHINNVFDEGELNRENNTQKVRVDGVKQPVAFYNLDTIISVGYRVNSHKATKFRIWATSVLKEYMLKGFAMDDERLKQGETAFGKDYFKEFKTKKNMGLTTWKNAPNGRILKSDVVIAKNYLEEKQIRQLERAVTGYFDYIEDLIERENTFTMEEFVASVNEFLSFRRYNILRDKGKISNKMAKKKATTEYMEFNKTQKITSDFDKAVNKMLKAGEEE